MYQVNMKGLKDISSSFEWGLISSAFSRSGDLKETLKKVTPEEDLMNFMVYYVNRELYIMLSKKPDVTKIPIWSKIPSYLLKILDGVVEKIILTIPRIEWDF